MTQTILITSGLGGVGKSTVCTFLARALAGLGKRVLLIEGFHRSLDVFFGVSEKVVFDISDVEAGRCSLDDAVLDLAYEQGINLLCAPMEGGFIPSPLFIQELIKAFKPHFDIILIEADAGEFEALDAYASQCSRAMIISKADPVNARICRRVSDQLDSYGVRDVRLCVNMLPVDDSWKKSIPDIDMLIDSICAQLISIIPYDRSLTNLPASKRALSNIAKEVFDNFAQRILGNYIDLLIQ